MNDFTLEQFTAAHAQVKSGADFPRYVQALRALGMNYYDFFTADGHQEYHSNTGQLVTAPAKYPARELVAMGDVAALKQAISVHQQGQTDFATFLQQSIDAGVERWRTDVTNLKCVYMDAAGNELLVEPIPDSAY